MSGQVRLCYVGCHVDLGKKLRNFRAHPVGDYFLGLGGFYNYSFILLPIALTASLRLNVCFVVQWFAQKPTRRQVTGSVLASLLDLSF